MVVAEDMEKAARAGKAVWDSQCNHKPMVIVVRRAPQ
jgi:hypothetical protein